MMAVRILHTDQPEGSEIDTPLDLLVDALRAAADQVELAMATFGDAKVAHLDGRRRLHAYLPADPVIAVPMLRKAAAAIAAALPELEAMDCAVTELRAGRAWVSDDLASIIALG